MKGQCVIDAAAFRGDPCRHCGEPYTRTRPWFSDPRFELCPSCGCPDANPDLAKLTAGGSSSVTSDQRDLVLEVCRDLVNRALRATGSDGDAYHGMEQFVQHCRDQQDAIRAMIDAHDLALKMQDAARWAADNDRRIREYEAIIDGLSERLRSAEVVRDAAREASAKDLEARRVAQAEVAELRSEVAELQKKIRAWRDS